MRRLVGKTAGRNVKATASARQNGTVWTLSLRTEVDGQPGERELQAPDCASLADAAAVILAWMLDPDTPLEDPPVASSASVTNSSAPPTSSSAPPASSGVAPSVVAPSASASASVAEPIASVAPPDAGTGRAVVPRSPPGKLRGGVLLGLGLEGGLVPGIGLGPVVAAELGGARWNASLGASWFPGQRADATARPGAAVRVDLATLGGRFCGAPVPRAPWARVCGGASVLRFSAEGEGVREPLRGTTAALALQAGAQARFPLGGSWIALLAVEAVAPLLRPTFRIEGLGAVYRVPALAPAGTVALGWSFR